MKATYIYKSAFGDSLLTITGKSAARGRDSVCTLCRANAVMRNHARKEGERMLAEMADMRRDFDNALRVAEKDKQALLDKVERLQEENKSLCAKVARLNAELADEVTFALHGWTLARKNAILCAKVSDRLHACRIDRRKWRDFANRCFMASLKNAVALADGRKRGHSPPPPSRPACLHMSPLIFFQKFFSKTPVAEGSKRQRGGRAANAQAQSGRAAAWPCKNLLTNAQAMCYTGRKERHRRSKKGAQAQQEGV